MPQSYKQHPPKDSFDAIVIGSGLGGLATAALLGKHGHRRVLVLEKHYTMGGFTHVFKRPGYEWDVGIHYMGAMGPGQDVRLIMDEVTDGAVDWARMDDPYNRVHVGDREFEYIRGKRRFAARMKDYFPNSARDIDAYLDGAYRATRTFIPYFADRALPRALSASLGKALRAPFMHYAKKTVSEVMCKTVQDPLLRAVLTAEWGDYGLPPGQASYVMQAAIATHYISGAYFPVGGSSVIAEAVEKVIERHGGRVLVSAEVASILVEGGRAVGVTMKDGRTLRAPIVISDAGLRLTRDVLLAPEHRRRPAWSEGLSQVQPSVGHLCLHLGIKESDAALGTSGSNLWIFPSADHDGNCARLAEDPDAPFPVVFVSFPSVKDPTWPSRYPGRSTIEVVAPAPYEWFAKWEGSRWHKRGADYDEYKERLKDRLFDILYAHLPALRGKVDFAELSTPLSTKQFTSHPQGEIYGLSHGPSRFRLPVRAETEIPGLYVTGADLFTAGVAGALAGGLITSAAILRGRLLASLMKQAW